MAGNDVSSSDMAGVFASPARTLVGTLVFVGLVFVAATTGYVLAGWKLGDAAYMVTLTIFSVGYGEVHPIDTSYLRALTIFTMVLGCTGMIVLTGALVQMFAALQLRRLLGLDRMQAQIERLNGHVIICGFGRIGVQLAKELHGAGNPFIVLERDAGKIAEAQGLGYLSLKADATDESGLRTARIDRAKTLATVLPDDAANVFITLSARSLNPRLEIIARGEAPTTESKLFHAGADKVVLPTHIGAERIAEMILYPSTAGFVAESAEMRDMKRGLHEFGLELEMVTAVDKGAMTGETVGEAERRGRGAFFIVQIDRAGGQSIAHPGEDVRIESGDNIVLVVRGSRVSAGAIFTTQAGPRKAGRAFY
jgi:trk system potassium uptake protein TrkA/voltage-gated potassium channel